MIKDGEGKIMSRVINKTKSEMLQYLKLKILSENWNEIIKKAEDKEESYDKFLIEILRKEYNHRVEVAKKNMVKRARIPNDFTLETYPFEDQPQLNKKRLMERYDSLDYLRNHRNLVFIGPSGTGKTGLASSILRQALNNEYTGRFIEFSSLMEELLNSLADQSSKRVIKKYSGYDCLLIDDLSFLELEKSEIGLLYSLIQKRYKTKCTIITTSLGFSKWNEIFDNKQLTDALIGRLSDNGHIINLNKCKSIRKEPEIN
jgi:DNA replication protein DnaC